MKEWNRFDTEYMRLLGKQEQQQDGRGDRGVSVSRHEPQQLRGDTFVRVRWYYEEEGAAVDVVAVLAIKNDPAFKMYFRMLFAGIPQSGIKQKMEMDGIDPALLDSPDAPSPNQPKTLLAKPRHWSRPPPKPIRVNGPPLTLAEEMKMRMKRRQDALTRQYALTRQDVLSKTRSAKDLQTPIAVRWDNDNETTVGVHLGRIELVPSVQYAREQRLFVFHDEVWHKASVKAIVCASHPLDTGHSKHRLQLETGECVTIDLNDANHAPALFDNLQSREREMIPYRIMLKSEHGTIYDIFSAKELSTLTQTATLKYCEIMHRTKLLTIDVDTDDPGYQESQKSAPDAAGTNVTELLREILSVCNDRRVGYVVHRLLLILGPAASGKTTLLKTFIVVILRDYADYVPILISVISLVRVLDKCKAGESLIAAFLRTQYPQHLNVLTQAMFQRRAVFLVDGIDESGTRRNEVQAAVDEELLAPGHNTIITSRHGGFSSAAFRHCRLLELLPLVPSQQSEMVHLRVLNVVKAEQLVGELKKKAFREIASNPLMLTMLISLYVKNNYQVTVNRSVLYEQALRPMMGQIQSGGKLDEELFQHLQTLAFESHWRDGERRIFVEHEAVKWIGNDAWATIKEAIALRKLPIVISMGPDETDAHQYRFGHLSYQEFLAGRELHQRLVSVQPRERVGTMTALFGNHPATAFANTQHQLMLQFLADLLLASELLSECSEAMFGSDHLKLDKELGRAGAEALAPYVKANTTLRLLDVSGTKLGKSGMCVLAEAMVNTKVAHLDVSQNKIAEGPSGDTLNGVAALCRLIEMGR
jgi:hypothetical protein